MCTPSFMCKFPFRGRAFVAGAERVSYCWPRTAADPLASGGAQPMRNRRRQTRSQLDGLRLAIDCMPLTTREAMLEGVRAHERILVGAYVDDQGGVCPMLAAHRCGGRTDFLSFAKSWDRFARPRTLKGTSTGTLKGTGKRAATEREVR